MSKSAPELRMQILEMVKNGNISAENWIILENSLPHISGAKPNIELKAQKQFYSSIIDGSFNVVEFCDNYRKERIISKEDMNKYRQILSSASTDEEKKTACLYILDNVAVPNQEIKDMLLEYRGILTQLKKENKKI